MFTKLDLSACGIEDDSLNLFSNWLKTSSKANLLKLDLNLSLNHISASAMLTFLQAIEHTTSISSLTFGNAYQHFHVKKPEKAGKAGKKKSISDLLEEKRAAERRKPEETIKDRVNMLGVKGGELLAKIVLFSKHLTQLTLNDIDQEGKITLITMITLIFLLCIFYINMFVLFVCVYVYIQGLQHLWVSMSS